MTSNYLCNLRTIAKNEREPANKNQISICKQAKTEQLALKYTPKIKAALEKASKINLTKIYYNFDRKDFLNFGSPAEFCYDVINHMIKTDPDLEGLKYDVWNNGSFTTVFSY